MAYPSRQQSEMKICHWPPTLLVFVKENAMMTATARTTSYVFSEADLRPCQAAPVLDYLEKAIVSTHCLKT
jgi:hypothetical protein